MKTPLHAPVPGQDIWNYLGGKYFSQPQLTCVLRLDGRLNWDKLTRAVRLSLDSEPVLGCRIRDTGPQAVWEPRTDLDTLELCSQTDASGSANAVEAEVQRFVGELYDFDRHCQLRVRVIHADTDTLCIKAEHAATDAAGMKRYTRLLAQIYNDLFHYRNHVPQPARWENRSLEQVLQSPAAAPFLAKEITEPAEWVALPYQSAPAGPPEVLVRRLSPERFSLLKKYARKQQATVNDVLLTAYARAIGPRARLRDQCVAINMTTDLRRYLPAGDSGAVCNLSGMNPVIFPFQPAETFEETLCKVSNETKKIKQNGPGLQSAQGMFPLAAANFPELNSAFGQSFEQMRQSGYTNPWFSNLGIMADRPLEFGLQAVVDYYMVGPALYSPGLILLAGTYADTLTLTFNYFPATFDASWFKKLFDDLITDVTAAIQTA